MEKQSFTVGGYAILEKDAANAGTSARIFVPKNWAGKKCVVVLTEPIDE
jgi:putative transposon-encoded protein